MAYLSLSKNYFSTLFFKLLGVVNHLERSVGDELTVSNSWEGDYSSSVHGASGGIVAGVEIGTDFPRRGAVSYQCINIRSPRRRTAPAPRVTSYTRQGSPRERRGTTHRHA